MGCMSLSTVLGACRDQLTFPVLICCWALVLTGEALFADSFVIIRLLQLLRLGVVHGDGSKCWVVPHEHPVLHCSLLYKQY